MSVLSAEGSQYAGAPQPAIRGGVGYVQTGLSIASAIIASGVTSLIYTDVLPAGVYQMNYSVEIALTAGQINNATLTLLYNTVIQASSGGVFLMDEGRFSASAIIVSDGILATSVNITAITADASPFTVDRKQFSLCRIA